MLRLSSLALLLALFSFAAPRCVEVFDDEPVEASGVQEPEPFLNWGCANITGRDCCDKVPSAIQQGPCVCPDGWFNYADSCYMIVLDSKKFADAHYNCMQQEATLLVLNSQEEFENVRQRMPKSTWTWMGIYKFDEASPALWQSMGGLQRQDVNWLVKDNTDNVNGWSTWSKCGAHFTGLDVPSVSPYNYMYWYNCDFQFYSICERNATLINAMNQAQAVMY